MSLRLAALLVGLFAVGCGASGQEWVNEGGSSRWNDAASDENSTKQSQRPPLPAAEDEENFEPRASVTLGERDHNGFGTLYVNPDTQQHKFSPGASNGYGDRGSSGSVPRGGTYGGTNQSNFTLRK